MFWFVIIFIILLIIAVANTPTYSLSRENFDKSLEKLNSATKAKIICGVISILVALIPIIDLILPKIESGLYYHSYVSRIFKRDYSDGFPMFCQIIIWSFLIGWVLWFVSNSEYKKKNREKLEREVKEQEEKDAYAAAKKQEAEHEKKQHLALLTSQYGNPEKIINIFGDNIKNAFVVFPSSSCIVFKDKVIQYSELVSSVVKDETYTTTTGTKEEITRSSTGSTVGRAVVGGLIAGPAGAIIGGATSKKKTEVIDNTKTITHHNYYVVINLSTPANPVIKIDCISSSQKAEEINAIVTGIIANQAKMSVGGTSIADELAKLAVLKEKGILTETEFSEQKSRLLGQSNQLPKLTTNNILPK